MDERGTQPGRYVSMDHQHTSLTLSHTLLCLDQVCCTSFHSIRYLMNCYYPCSTFCAISFLYPHFYPNKSFTLSRTPYKLLRTSSIKHASHHLRTTNSVRSTTVPSSSTLRNLRVKYIPRNLSILTSPGKTFDDGSSV